MKPVTYLKSDKELLKKARIIEAILLSLAILDQIYTISQHWDTFYFKEEGPLLLISNIVLIGVAFLTDRFFCSLNSNNKIQNKLSNSEVYSLLEDKNGFIWIGTLDGLNRFDGYTVKQFNVGNGSENALSNNTIFALNEDHKGRIWIGTNDGLNIYEPTFDRFTHVSLNKNFSSNEKIITLEIVQEHLFVGTGQGFYIIDLNHDVESIKNNNIYRVTELYATTTINCLKKDPNDDHFLWVASNVGMAKISFQPENKRIQTEFIPKLLKSQYIVDIDFDKDNNLWYSTNKGLNKYSIQANKKELIANLPLITDLLVDENDDIWVASKVKGLHIYNKEKQEIATIKNTTSPLIKALYLGRDKTMWLGTIGDGVNYLDVSNNPFKNYVIPKYVDDKLISHFVRSVYKDEETQKIYFGLQNGGISVFDIQKNTTTRIGLNNYIVFDIKKINGEILVTGRGGLYKVDEKNNKLINVVKIFGACTYLIEGKDKNTLWLTSIRGLYQLKKQKDNTYKKTVYSQNSVPNLSGRNTRIAYYDREYNEIWVGFEGNGINILSLDSAQNVKNVTIINSNVGNKDISNDYVRSIIKNKNGDYLIGTYNGLNIMKRTGNGRFTNTILRKEQGLLSNMIQSIQEDSTGTVWIGTNDGLSKLTFHGSSYDIVNYNENNGLPSSEFSEHAVSTTTNGEIFFGTNNLFFSFKPEDVIVKKNGSTVSIEDIKVLGERVNPNQDFNGEVKFTSAIQNLERLKLAPNENSFSVDFMIEGVSRSRRISYAYKLKGYDEKWQYLKNRKHQVSFANLSYGEYTLLYKASSDDGFFDDQYKSLVIIIDKPYYLKWYAFVIYAVILLGAVYIAYLSKLKKEVEQNFNDQANYQIESNLKAVIEKEEKVETSANETISANASVDVLVPVQEEVNVGTESKTAVEEKKDEVETIEDKPRLSIQDEKFLNKLTQAIADGLSNSEFTIEELEREIGMSHSNFYRKVKKVTGRSAKDILQEARLKKAAYLILQGEYRISDVAYIVGFNNPKYFSKCFKEYYGETPSNYEKSMNNKTNI